MVLKSLMFRFENTRISVDFKIAYLLLKTQTLYAQYIERSLRLKCGPSSAVGIVTGYELDVPGIESRWGARFSAPVQTGPGAHPDSGSFPRVKSGRGVTLTAYPLLVPWS